MKEFGESGRIDLRQGLDRDATRLTVQANSPGVVYRDMLILGMLTSEDLPSAPGHIRAFDVRTGKLRWKFPHHSSAGRVRIRNMAQGRLDLRWRRKLMARSGAR